MQISDEAGGFARLGRHEFVGLSDNALRQPELSRDGDAARSARHAHAQPVGGRQALLIELHRRVQHARRCRSIRLQPVVVRGGQDQAASPAKLVEQRHRQRRALFRRRPRAHLVQQHQRTAA